MSISRIAGRYAKSVLDLAQEQNNLETVREDMLAFAKATKVRDLYLLLKSPIIPGGKKKTILTSIFDGKVDKLTMAFFNIVLTKGREAYLPEMADAFEEQYRELKGITSVKLTTASPLTEEVLNTIKAKLEGSDQTNNTIEIETAVNPDLIGGFMFEFGDRLYDASVAHRLAEIKKEFAK